MDPRQAKRLGRLFRSKREELGISSHQVARESGLNQATIVRLEQGGFLNPDPEKLRVLAEALGLNLTDVLSLAGYPIPTELPSTGPYLRAKYRELSESALSALTRDVNQLLARHGLDTASRPAPGEDETPEAARSPKPPAPRTRTKKGGTP